VRGGVDKRSAIPSAGIHDGQCSIWRTTVTTTQDDDADWLRSIREHPETTDADHAMAEEILLHRQLTYRQRNSAEVKHLEDLECLFVNPGGRWEPVPMRYWKQEPS
jgi:hypothetical protein